MMGAKWDGKLYTCVLVWSFLCEAIKDPGDGMGINGKRSWI